MKRNNYKIWYTVFDGENTSDGGGDVNNASGDIKKAFSQEDVNRMIADERRVQQQKIQSVLNEMNALKTKATLTSEERVELEKRTEELQNELLTKEEIAKKNESTLKKAHEKEKETITHERDSWKKLYTDSTIVNSIVDAAVKSNAYNPDQIVSILKDKTRLVEALDTAGKPTGKFIPKVKIVDYNDKNEEITLDLTPTDAVKRLSERNEYLNLFKGNGTGALGLHNVRNGRGELSASDLAKQNPAEYRKQRREGKIKL